jgi:GNAT superfamily N-acetyltransferase
VRALAGCEGGILYLSLCVLEPTKSLKTRISLSFSPSSKPADGGGAAPAPPPPSPSGQPPPRFPPPTPAPDGSLPPPPAAVTPLGLPDVAVLAADPLTLADAGGGQPPTHAFSLVLGPDALTPASMAALTAAAGWPARPPDRLAAALAGSYLCAGVVLTPLESGGGGENSSPPILVGAARATSDAAFNATLWDVLVHPAVRGRGVGTALVERVTAALLEAGLGNVTLFSSPGALPFYGGLGFEADPEGIRGMFYVGE